MKLLKTLALASLVCASGWVAAQNVKIVGLVELTGTGTTSGTNFDNGIKLAVKEINSAGGILGKKIDYVSYDTQSNPGVAKGLADKAVDEGAYVVMGPVFSGSIMVSMASTRRAEIPNFTGGEAAAITQLCQAIDLEFLREEIPTAIEQSVMPRASELVASTHIVFWKTSRASTSSLSAPRTARRSSSITRTSRTRW